MWTFNTTSQRVRHVIRVKYWYTSACYLRIDLKSIAVLFIGSKHTEAGGEDEKEGAYGKFSCHTFTCLHTEPVSVVSATFFSPRLEKPVLVIVSRLSVDKPTHEGTTSPSVFSFFHAAATSLGFVN